MTFYFHVIDNGEGSNAPDDQFSNAIYVSESSDCETYCSTCVDWDWAGYFNATEGNVQVDN